VSAVHLFTPRVVEGFAPDPRDDVQAALRPRRSGVAGAADSPDMADGRSFPARPILAVSAAIVRDGRVLIVRRARPPARGLYTLPGGGVEVGESLVDAVAREVREETALEVLPLGLAGYREAIVRADDGRVERHFVILPFAARFMSGEIALNEELSEAHWLAVSEVAPLETTAGLLEIIAAALKIAQA
jgi:8-oxo-dGTP diphosphatase